MKKRSVAKSLRKHRYDAYNIEIKLSQNDSLEIFIVLVKLFKFFELQKTWVLRQMLVRLQTCWKDQLMIFARNLALLCQIVVAKMDTLAIKHYWSIANANKLRIAIIFPLERRVVLCYYQHVVTCIIILKNHSHCLKSFPVSL